MTHTPEHKATGTSLFDPDRPDLRLAPPTGADTSFGDLSQVDTGLYEQMYLNSIGLGGTGPRSRHDQWRANRFADVRAQYALDRAGLHGFGDPEEGQQRITPGRTFQEYLDLIKGASNQYGGYNTSRNMSAISDLSDVGVMGLRERIGDQGFNVNEIMNQAFRNAATSRFGSRYGGNIADRALSQRKAFALTPEGQDERSFTRQLLDQLKRQFGIETGNIAPRAEPLAALRGLVPIPMA